jgi:glycosyltransferase involved in cell wall biosynthesis
MNPGHPPLRVLHVIPAVAPRYGGPSRAVLEMCRALQGRAITSLLVTTDADGGGRLPVELGRPVSYGGVPAIFFARQYSERFKYSRPLARWLAEHVAEFDVVHIHAVFSHACLAAASRCRRARVPYVVRPLGTLDPWSLGQHPVRKRLVWLLAAKRMLWGAAAIHYTASGEQRAVEDSLGLRRGHVVPLGIEEELLAEPAAPAILGRSPAGLDPYVLMLSRLHPKKGLELFLDVFLETVRDDGLGRWRLVVAGDGDPTYVQRLKRLVRERQGEDRVRWTGWLQGDARTAVLRGAQLLALPSHQENMGLAAMEALACGVPVLISDRVSLAGDVEAGNAGWVARLERGDLTKTLREAFQDEDERARRGRAGRDLVRHRFRWASIAGELEALYASVLRDATNETGVTTDSCGGRLSRSDPATRTEGPHRG